MPRPNDRHSSPTQTLLGLGGQRGRGTQFGQTGHLGAIERLRSSHERLAAHDTPTDLGNLNSRRRLAAFLPWVSIFGISALGVEGDGVLTLLLAMAGGVVLGLTSGLFGQEKAPGKKSQITLLLLAVVVALIGLMDMNGAAAIGLYLTLFGGAAWVVGAAWQLSGAKQERRPARRIGRVGRSRSRPGPRHNRCKLLGSSAAGWARHFAATWRICRAPLGHAGGRDDARRR